MFPVAPLSGFAPPANSIRGPVNALGTVAFASQASRHAIGTVRDNPTHPVSRKS